jgi:hypothetical protein
MGSQQRVHFAKELFRVPAIVVREARNLPGGLTDADVSATPSTRGSPSQMSYFELSGKLRDNRNQSSVLILIDDDDFEILMTLCFERHEESSQFDGPPDRGDHQRDPHCVQGAAASCLIAQDLPFTEHT